MNIFLKEGTAEALKAELNKKGKMAVRIVIKGFGWGGPSLGVVLDEQTDKDDIVSIEGIDFVADKEISFILTDAKISYHKGLFGNSFNITNGTSSC